MKPVFVLHDHRKPRPHFDLRLEQDGVLRSWAVPKGMPTDVKHDRLAVAVGDHDMDHATYTDEHKSIADHGWWDLIDSNERRLVFELHGERGVVRYALIDTGRDWLLHLTKDQPGISDPYAVVMDLITFEAPGGTVEAHVATPPSGSGPGVLLFMDAIGLRPELITMAERIASWGYVVLTPNLFYRDGTAEELMPKGDLRQPGERESFFEGVGPRMGNLTTDKSTADTAVFHQTLLGLDAVVGDHVGTVGYCMGARLVTRYAGAFPDNVVAAAGFHGGGLVTDQADSPHHSIATARAEFVYGHADNDGSMPPEAVQALGAALDAAGLTATNEIYPDAPHGYSMADTSMYQEAGAERSFTELEALFARTLR
ncbi:dienelactone hydrolase family protein [Williamsia maris]|uniref:DNA ligase D, 3'-phosphoesterase domain-containing protein n=1 Tax=Williamsia maris TaxID=72806 RepID=A0ABT1HBR2_9NOCA|nr:dienelactone hydrolase family protein [Williamsia maris]MCP2175686.1 DNA ligase D, 3'-phosphoesterase domain-containing protein [Williamsia maris]